MTGSGPCRRRPRTSCGPWRRSGRHARSPISPHARGRCGGAVGAGRRARASGFVAASDDRIVLAERLVGEAVVTSLAPPLRRALQRQAAEVLVTEGGEATEIAGAWWRAWSRRRRRDPALLDATRRLGALDPSVAADVGGELFARVSVDDPLYGAIAAETAVLLHAAGRHAHATAVAEMAFRRRCRRRPRVDCAHVSRLRPVCPDTTRPRSHGWHSLVRDSRPHSSAGCV